MAGAGWGLQGTGAEVVNATGRLGREEMDINKAAQQRQELKGYRAARIRTNTQKKRADRGGLAPQDRGLSSTPPALGVVFPRQYPQGLYLGPKVTHCFCPRGHSGHHPDLALSESDL